MPLNSEYTITSYRMSREDRHGHMASTANWRYDLMELVMVCLGRPKKAEKGTELHQLLTVVLSDELSPEEKLEVMHKEFDIVTTVEMEGGLVKMCNLSDYIEEKAMQKGIEQGIEQGMQQGVSLGIYKTLTSLIKQGIITVEKAAEEAGVTVEEFKQLCHLQP